MVWACSGLIYALLHLAHMADNEEWRRLEASSRLFALSGIVFLPLWLRLTWRDLFWPLVGAGLSYGLLAIHPPPTTDPDHRLFGYYTYRNMMGFAPMVTALMLAALWGSSHGLRRWALGLALAGSLAASLLSGTRGAWPGILVLLMVLWRSSHPASETLPGAPHWKRRAALALVIVLSGWAAYAPFKTRLATTQGDLEHIRQGDMSGSIGSRVVMLRYALEMIEAHPLKGNGLSAFHDRIIRWSDEKGLPWWAMERGYQNPHNQYLHWAQSLGLPTAAGCIVALLVFPVWVGRRCRGEARTALLGITATVPIFMLTEAILDRHHGSQWFALVYGLTLGIGLVSMRSASPPTGAEASMGREAEAGVPPGPR